MHTIIDLCLLCLKNNKNLKSIYSRDSDGIHVEEKLRFFLFELWNLDPDILKHICLPCLDKLNLIYNYKLQCLRNIDKLNTYKFTLNTTKEPCLNLQFDTKNLKENQVISENEDNSEPVRSESFNLDDVIMQKEPSVDDTKVKYTLQGEHGQKPDIEEQLKEEIAVKQEPDHNSDNNKAEEENAITGIEETKITEDEVKFEYVDVPVKEEPEDLYNETDTWSKLCDLKEELQNETANNAATSTAKENFMKLTNLTTHEQIHSGEKPYTCDVCNRAFSHQHALTRHKYIHNNERPHVCSVCSKTFIQIGHLVVHERIHTGEKPYKCNICNKAFTSRTCLIRHEKVHNNVRPYKCNVCNRAFSHQHSLTRHKYIHNNDRPHKCSVCDKAFTLKSNLIVHERIHTGEKPYKCNVCNKAFTHQNTLIRHKYIHNNVRP